MNDQDLGGAKNTMLDFCGQVLARARGALPEALILQEERKSEEDP